MDCWEQHREVCFLWVLGGLTKNRRSYAVSSHYWKQSADVDLLSAILSPAINKHTMCAHYLNGHLFTGCFLFVFLLHTLLHSTCLLLFSGSMRSITAIWTTFDRVQHFFAAVNESRNVKNVISCDFFSLAFFYPKVFVLVRVTSVKVVAH